MESTRQKILGREARRQVAASTLKTGFLLAALALVTAAVGYLLLGGLGLLIGGMVIAVLLGGGSQISERAIMRMQGGRPLRPEGAPGLHRMVAGLAERAGIPMPRLYLLTSAEANALATGGGREAGALGVSRGALNSLTGDELEAVLAHEVAHLKNRDTRLLQLAGLVSYGLVGLLRATLWVTALFALFGGAGLGQIGLLVLLALGVPSLVSLITAALSRTREIAADTAAAQLSGKPWALASALTKIEHQQSHVLRLLFGAREGASLFRSHPPTHERVKRLRDLAPAPAVASTRPRAVPIPIRRLPSRPTMGMPVLYYRGGFW